MFKANCSIVSTIGTFYSNNTFPPANGRIFIQCQDGRNSQIESVILHEMNCAQNKI